MLTAHHIIKQLVHSEVRYFCIAPGSRCTPLVCAAAEHPLAETFVHFDERGLAFHALGYTKSSGKPAALIVTSGTALGNLLPAIMEAKHSGTPLIILTADRPPELLDCGANQATSQTNIFGSFVAKEYQLATDQNLPHSYYGSVVSEAVATALEEGPVHINCPFREPFIEPTSLPDTYTAQTNYTIGKRELDNREIHKLVDKFSRTEKGVIIAGRGYGAKALEEIATKLQWPILTDALSKNRCWQPSLPYIPHFDLLLKKHDWNPDTVLHFGDCFVSKQLLSWLNHCKPNLYMHISKGFHRQDPAQLVTHRIAHDPTTFCKKALPYIPHREKGWLAEWSQASKHLRRHIHTYFEKELRLSDAHLFHILEKILDPGSILFAGNGMPIRAADAFFFPGTPMEIYGNRGLSGIDGLIATAIGVAIGKKTPVYAIIGDQSALHDLNSLAMLQNISGKVVIFIINNGGGQIFSFLPIAENKAVYDKYFANKHNLHFKETAEMFNLRYLPVRTLDQLIPAIGDAKSSPHSIVVEVFTGARTNVDTYAKIIQSYKPKSKLQCLFEKSESIKT
jgi:2-succinyl-5-enolpyruvyl-6-hydroxy-3-cyclohexene-1-carboxylate synthase